MGSTQLCLVLLRAAERERVLLLKESHPYSYLLHLFDCDAVCTLPRGVYRKMDDFLKCSLVTLINAMIRVTVRIITTDPVPPPPQVTWIYEPKEGERINIAVFHPSFDPNFPDSPVKGRVSFTPSPPNLVSPSIQISEVRMTDEGKYICEYATYPSGNEQGITYLVMLGRSLIHNPCNVYRL